MRQDSDHYLKALAGCQFDSAEEMNRHCLIAVEPALTLRTAIHEGARAVPSEEYQ